MATGRTETGEHDVVLLTREGCSACGTALEVLRGICGEFGLTPRVIDVDLAAADDPELRAEYGDRLPVVLLDGEEHSYWTVDTARLSADLGR
nr:glutaredoxin family protein [Millisia brevis]